MERIIKMRIMALAAMYDVLIIETSKLFVQPRLISKRNLALITTMRDTNVFPEFTITN